MAPPPGSSDLHHRPAAPPRAGARPGAAARLAAAADRLDAAHPDGPGPVAEAWAVLRLLGVGVVGPVLLPLVGLLAARNTARTLRRIDDLPVAVAALVEGAPASPPFRRVGRLPADVPVVVTSDLHRAAAGRTDWPRRLDTEGLYLALLDHYGAQGWHLVEDGDVEDLWMVGGSTWGALYDVGRLAGAVVPGVRGRRWRRRLVGTHLDRIVANNDATYARINDRFHLHGRYHRVVGNHDDAFEDEAVVERLRRHHPGLDVLDALVLGGAGGPAAVVTHGHHVDAWNAPDLAWLGRLGTWLACALEDLPLVGLSPGLAGPEQTARLLDGTHPDLLTVVSRAFGANRELYSVDEELLFRAWRRHWGEGDEPDLDGGPALVLGHSHLALDGPRSPADGGRWRRYLNSGSGVLPRLVTAVEWDPSTPDEQGWPARRLVAWAWAADVPEAAPVAEAPDGRPVVRLVLTPTGDGRLAPAVGERRG